MEFVYQDYLSLQIFEELNEIKSFHPEIIEEEASRKEKPSITNKNLVFVAADHNARMINEYKGDPIGLSNRMEYLARLVRVLQSDRIDGIEATADIIEDLMIINRLLRQQGKRDFMRGKMLIGTVNRGGLKNTVWEMDDMRTCFTVSRIAAMRMDGVKFMIRLNPSDPRAKETLAYCAQTINEAADYKLPVFIEALYVDTEGERFVMKTDTESLCKVVGVVGALGCTSVNKWIEVPLNSEYRIPTAATTCPVLVVPDEREEEPLAVVREYVEQIGMNYNIRGILLGRNVLYNTQDPLPIADAIANVWHSNVSPDAAYKLAVDTYRLM